MPLDLEAIRKRLTDLPEWEVRSNWYTHRHDVLAHERGCLIQVLTAVKASLRGRP